MGVEVIKSPLDKKLYRKVDLANGLQCLLISDPEMGSQGVACTKGEVGHGFLIQYVCLYLYMDCRASSARGRLLPIQ